MADIVINPAIGKIDFFSVKGDNVTNTLKLTGNTLLVTGPLSASSISTGGGGAFVTSAQPTSNFLSKFTGNSTIANSLIYDNGTNVGVGTTSPADKFHVIGNVRINGGDILNWSGQAFIQTLGNYDMFFRPNSTLQMILTGNGNLGIGSGFTNPLAKLHVTSATSGATLLRADGTNGTLFSVIDDLSDSLMSVNNSAGLPVLEVFADDRIVGGQYGTNDFVVINNKVGIGTNNPVGKLHVTGSASVPAAVFYGNVGIGTSTFSYPTSNRGLLELYGNTDALLALRSAGTNFYIHKPGVDCYIVNTNSGFISIYNNGSERMRIDTNGNLGIGTSSPGVKLDVIGGVRSFSSAGNYGLITNGSFQAVGDHGGTFMLDLDNTGAADLVNIKKSGTSRFYITNGGNVGIGSTSPATKLDLKGNLFVANAANGNNTIAFGNIGTLGPLNGAPNNLTGSAFLVVSSSTASGAPSHMKFFTTTGGTCGERMRIAADGNVGIGTTSPAYKLDVSGTGRVGDVFLITTATTSDARLEIGSGRSGNGNSYVDLIGDATYPDFGLRLIRYDTGANANSRLEHKGTGQLQLFSTEAGSVTISTTSTERMRVDSSGNIGIGTTTPSQLLHVAGNVKLNSVFGEASTTGVTAITHTTDSTQPSMYLWGKDHATYPGQVHIIGRSDNVSADAGRIAFYDYNGSGWDLNMVINKSGNVGIGTSTPRQILHINGSILLDGLQNGYEQGSTRAIGYGSNSGAVNTDGFSGMDIQSVNAPAPNGGNYSQNVRFWTHHYGTGTGNTPRMILQYNGNVGIGTTSPIAKLEAYGGSMDPTLTPGDPSIFSVNSLGVQLAVGRMVTTPFSVWFQGKHATVGGGLTYPIVLNPLGGNVGIGTTSPASKLHISGSGQTIMRLDSDTTTSVSQFQIKAASDAVLIMGMLGGSAASTNFGVTAAGQAYFGTSTLGSPHPTSLVIGNVSNIPIVFSTTNTERMRILSDGNVGIGTTSPGYKLEVTGTGFFSSNLTANGVTIGASDVRSSSNILTLGGTSERIRIDTNGNVGIGTSSPRVLLDLAKANNVGQVLLIGETSTNVRTGFGLDSSTAGMRIFCPNLSSQAIDMGGISTSDGSTWTRNHSFGVAGKNSWLNEQGGNVGVGTSSPSATLTVIATNNTGSRIQLGTASTSTFMDANKVNDFMVLTAPFGNNPASVSNAGAKWGIKMNGSIDGINTKGKAACIYAVSEDGAGYNRTVGMALHTSGFDLDNAERVRITNGGYVGIGTSTTTSGLQIQTEGTNTASGSFLFVRSTNASFGGGAIGVGYQYAAAVGNNYTPFRIRGGSTNAIFTINSSGTVYAGDTTGAVIYGNHDPYYTFNQDTNTGMDWAAADTLTFKTGGTERLRIDTNGNVGIGTTVQNQKLSIYPGTTGGISLQDSGGTTRSYFFIDNTNPTYSTGIRTTNYYIDFDSSGGAQNAIRFYTGTGAIGTGTERMRVTGTGNIGIGTSSPISKLNAYASGSNLSVLKIDGGNGTLFEVTDQLSGSLFSVNTIAGLPVMEAFSNNRVVMGKYNANDFVISGSRVGIGTSNPSNKTTIEADATGVSFADNGIGQLVIRGATNTAKRLALGIDTTNNIGVIQSQLYGTGQYPLALNPAGGSVGIGTTSPTAKLYVSAGTLAVNTRAMFINADITTNSSVYTHTLNLIDGSADANPTSLALGLYSHVVFRNRPVSAGSAGGILDIYTRGVLTDPTVKMTITDVGNVGIGTTSPSGKLHLDDATAPYITITRTGVPTWQLRNNFPSNQYGFSFNNTTAGTVPLFIGAGGNIGIGLDSPGAKLDIASTQANGIVMRFDTSTNYNAWIRPYWNSNTDTRIDFAINRSAGVTPDVIMSVGYGTNVGIGTTAPVAKLHTVTTTAGSTVIRADGTSGTLFSVVDDLSDSLMSVNNSAGLPVFEVFANDRIVGGQYGVNDFVVINNKVGIGTNNPSGKLHVSGSNATSIIDGLSIGRGSGNVVTNTVIGNGALSSNTTGFYNSAIGYKALYSNTFGEYNTAVGYQALFSNTEGINNDAFGAQSLYSNTFGYSNSAFGMYSMYSNTIGNNNSAFGYGTLYENIEGNLNCAFGAQVLRNNTLGNYNNSFGYESMRYNTTGENNSAFGAYALRKNTTGIKNNAFGNWALESNTFGYHNNAFGYLALTLNTIGNNNSAFGYRSLYSNTTGSNNNSFGYKALFANTTSNNNAFGYQALYTSTTGSRNSAFGHMALRNLTTASDNTAFGYKTLLSGSNGQFSQRNTAMGSRASEAGGGVSNSAFGFEALRYSGFNANSAFGAYTLRNQRTTGTANSNSAFGYKALINNISGYTNSAFGANAGTTVTGGINLTIIGASAEPSSATATNQITLGNSSVTSLRCQVTTITALSDFRDKTDITDIQLGLSFVEKLRPVTFKWDRREWYTDGNRDGSKKDSVIQAGFIAQELKALQEEEGVEFLKLVYEDNPDKLEATPGNLMIPLIKAVQELSTKVKTLEAKVQILESK